MKILKILTLSCFALMMGAPCVAQDFTGEKKDAVEAQGKDDSQKVFEVVDKMPEFPGGMKKLLAWLQKNTQYPKQSRKNNVQGRVIIKFVIDKDGKAVEPTIEKSVDPYIDKEAIRLVNAMPKWTPGEHKGEPVRVKFTMPIVFRLSSPTNR